MQVESKTKGFHVSFLPSANGDRETVISIEAGLDVITVSSAAKKSHERTH